MFQRFGLSGLKGHVPSTVVAALLGLIDAVLSWFNVLNLPPAVHAVVGVLVLLFATYKGKIAATLTTVALLLLAPFAAHAQSADPSTATTTAGATFDGGTFQNPGFSLPKLSVDLGKGFSFQSALGWSGTMYVHTSQGTQIFKSVTANLYGRLGTPWPVDPVLGPAFSTGAAQGYGGSLGVVEKLSGVGTTGVVSVLRVGKVTTLAYGIGTTY